MCHNLPHLPSSFVGRREDIAEVGALLARSRLVTLGGAGGMGKTRLALQVAMSVAPGYPDGVWLADLTLTDPAEVAPAIANVVPGRDSQAESQSAHDVAGQIGERSMLVVLDNCDHLVGECAELVDIVLRSCAGVAVLVTSREPLGIVGEHIWWLNPLPVPAAGDVSVASVAASDAVELFLQRATAVCPTFRLTGSMAPVVGEICRRLDGMPLAIELAASRMASLSPDDILERLDDRFRVLDKGGRTVVARHQTLAASLESSNDLLTSAEAVLLRRVSVFAGWTLVAAEEVASGDEVDEANVVDHLGQLVNKSLVVADTSARPVRYRLLQTIRAWAGTKLAADPEHDAVHKRHAAWCLGLVERAERMAAGRSGEEPGERGPPPWIGALDAEHDNLRAALGWARDNGELELELRLATALTTYWCLRGHLSEGVKWLEWGVEAEGRCPPLLRARALRGLGLFRGMLGDVPGAITLLEQASTLFDACGDDGADVSALNPLLTTFPDPRAAIVELEDKISVYRAARDPHLLAQLVLSCGQTRFFLGEMAEARRCFEECIALGLEIADSRTVGYGVIGLGRVAMFTGDYPAAQVTLAEAWALAQEAGDVEHLATAAGLFGDLARATGRQARARESVAESIELAHGAGSPQSTARALYFAGRTAQSEDDDRRLEAGELFERSLSLCRSGGGAGFHEARCLVGMGIEAQARGAYRSAAGHFLEALQLAQSIADRPTTAHALDGLARLARAEGKADEARTLAYRALEVEHQLGEHPAVVASLELLGGLSADAGQYRVAARLLAAAEARREMGGWVRSPHEQAVDDADVSAVRAGAGPEAFGAAWSEGASLSLEEAVAYAVRGRGARQTRPSSGWDSLTPAELQVVRLVREGLTNPEVGRRLFISPRTVGHHLANVYGKLNIHSRSDLRARPDLTSSRPRAS